MKYSFAEFELDLDAEQLSLQGKDIALEPRVFGLLQLLIENRHRVVSKDEVIQQLWKGRFTSDAAVSTCVKSLRKALQDDGEQQRFIRTQWGKGFRFVADVTESDAAPCESTTPVIVGVSAIPQSTQTSALQGKPSLIVLPWQSLIVGHQDGVLAEAMAHELIQCLARLRWLRVIARGTAFQFSPTADLREVGAALSVRYALSGTLEAMPDGWAITVELSQCDTAEVLWAERYQARTAALFDIRQEIISSVIAALEIYIPQQEAAQAVLQTTEDLDAWAHYHLGLRHVFRFNRSDNALAREHFQRATELDPRFARAWGGLSFTRFQDAFVQYDSQRQAAIRDARQFAETSVELDPLDPFTNFNMGRCYWLESDPAGGMGWLERSVTLSPNFAQGHYSCAFSEAVLGNASKALTDVEKALSTSPLDPLLYAIYGVKSFGCLMQDDLSGAVINADKGARAPGAHFLIHMIAASVYALAGDQQAASYWHDRARKLNPAASTAQFLAAFPFVDGNFRERMLQGLQRAGFPP